MSHNHRLQRSGEAVVFEVVNQLSPPAEPGRSPIQMYLHVTVLFATALLTFLPGCGDASAIRTQAGSIPNAAKPQNTIPWERSAVAGWRYELKSVDTVTIYSFMPQGHVVATIGGRDSGGAMAVAGPVFYWRICDKGHLLISDEPNAAFHTELVLLELNDGKASVWNVGRSAIERYARSSKN